MTDATMGRLDADLQRARVLAESREIAANDGMALWGVIHLAEAEMARRRSVSGKPIYSAPQSVAGGSTEQPTPYTREELDAVRLAVFINRYRRYWGDEANDLALLLDRLLATARQGLEDAERLDWLEKHSVVIDYGDDIESGDREITLVHGGLNDREYTTVGTGPTVRAAFDAILRPTLRRLRHNSEPEGGR